MMIVHNTPSLQIIPIPALADNYIWLIHNQTHAIVVDPGDAAPVLQVLAQHSLTLEAILVTHHHRDHIDGIADLLAAFPNVQVFAPRLEHYTFRHQAVAEPNTLHFANGLPSAQVLNVAGHTLGHVAYVMHHADDRWLFCGDTLFGAGCGRLFEGSPAQMYASLQKLAALPPNTFVCCTHEYTLHNIAFALTLEPHNAALIKRALDTEQLRAQQLPSLPSTIALELATNPFLRCHVAEIQTNLGAQLASPVEIFSQIRELRNHY